MNHQDTQLGAAAEGCAAKRPTGCMAEDSAEGYGRVIASPPNNAGNQIQQNLVEIETSLNTQSECAAAEDALETKYFEQCSEDDDDDGSSSDREWWGSDDDAA